LVSIESPLFACGQGQSEKAIAGIAFGVGKGDRRSQLYGLALSRLERPGWRGQAGEGMFSRRSDGSSCCCGLDTVPRRRFGTMVNRLIGMNR
jgi:hypothetical protein